MRYFPRFDEIKFDEIDVSKKMETMDAPKCEKRAISKEFEPLLVNIGGSSSSQNNSKNLSDIRVNKNEVVLCF